MARLNCYNRECSDGKIYCRECCGDGTVSTGIVSRILGTEKRVCCSVCKGCKYWKCSDCGGKGYIEGRDD